MSTALSRRRALQTLFGGLSTIGLSDLLAPPAEAAAVAGHYPEPLRSPKAKHVIFRFMTGGPSQIDLFDPKPALLRYQGQRPSSVDIRTERQTGGLMPSPFAFRKMGQSGVEVSELLPQLGAVIDEICVIRSMYTFNPTHTPARSLIHTGSILATRPSLRSWIVYSLGTENANLPGFVALSENISGGGSLLRAGFLPAQYQGTALSDTESDPGKMISDLKNPWMDAEAQRRQIDTLQALNREFSDSFGPDRFLEARIQAMESAFRMQFEASDVLDVRNEPASVRDAYGDSSFANGCLLARRMVERGVRYGHVYYGAGQV